MRRNLSVILALGTVLLWVLVTPLPTAAASCAIPNDCRSVVKGSGTAHESGAQIYFNYPTSSTFVVGDANFEANFVQFILQNGSFVVMGVCDENFDSQCTGVNSFGLFVFAIAYNAATKTYHYYDAGITADGSYHTFTMQGTSTCHTDNSWYFSIDGNVFAHSPTLGTCWGYVNQIQAGGRIQGSVVPDGTQSTGGFSDYLSVFDSSWHALTSHGTQIDAPCSNPPTTNCFDGYYFTDNHWGWDKRT